MSWGNWNSKKDCKECKKELNYYEKVCKEFQYCYEHRKKFVDVNHVKKCGSCKKIFKEFPECNLCRDIFNEWDIFNLPNCGEHSYCSDCLNGHKCLERLRKKQNNPNYQNYPSYSNYPNHDPLDQISCNQCRKYFKSLLTSPLPPNCFICGAFAEVSEICRDHQYCKGCRNYFLIKGIKKIERVAKCAGCAEEFDLDLSQQRKNKKEEEKKRLEIEASNNWKGLNNADALADRMEIDEPYNNPALGSRINHSDEGSPGAKNLHSPYGVQNPGEIDPNTPNKLYTRSNHKDEPMDEVGRKNLRHDYYRENSGAQNKHDLYGAQNKHDLYGAQNKHDLYVAQNEHNLYGAQNEYNLYGAQNEHNLYGAQNEHNLYGAQNEHNLYGAQNEHNLYGAQNAGRNNPNIQNIVYSPGDPKSAYMQEIQKKHESLNNESSPPNKIHGQNYSPNANLTEMNNFGSPYLPNTENLSSGHSQTGNIEQPYEDISVLIERQEEQRRQEEQPYEDISVLIERQEEQRRQEEMSKLQSNEEVKLESQYKNEAKPILKMEKNEIQPKYPLSTIPLITLPEITICAYCQNIKGILSSECGHSFCEFCLFYCVIYPSLANFMNSMLGDGNFPQVFTYSCYCSKTFTSFYPAIKLIAYIKDNVEKHTRDSMGEYYDKFKNSFPYIEYFEKYSFYLDGLSCSFETCKNCGKIAALIEGSSYCPWCTMPRNFS